MYSIVSNGYTRFSEVLTKYLLPICIPPFYYNSSWPPLRDTNSKHILFSFTPSELLSCLSEFDARFDVAHLKSCRPNLSDNIFQYIIQLFICSINFHFYIPFQNKFSLILYIYYIIFCSFCQQSWLRCGLNKDIKK